jgi:hypothetical protein
MALMADAPLTPDEKLSAIKAKLKQLAEQASNLDDFDFNAYDFSGGNYDDAHSMGMGDGKISLARQMLKEFFGE